MPAPVTTADKETNDLRSRARAVHDQFAASGTNIAQWARERGFSERIVRAVLSGRRACVRGDSHRVAVALGIKADVAAPGADRRRPSAEDLAVAP